MFFAGLFELDNTTGIVTVAKSLDREVNHTVRFTVRAQDQAAPFYTDYADVTVMVTDVNDNAPVIEPKEISVEIKEVRFKGIGLINLVVFLNWKYMQILNISPKCFAFKGCTNRNIYC